MSLIPKHRNGYVLTFFCSFLIFTASAQERIPLKNSGTLIEYGINKHNAGEYKDAIEFYKQIPEGDTNYAIALHELVVTALADSQFKEAKTWSQKGLLLPHHPYSREFMLMLGHSYDYLGQSDSAFICYDNLIKLNPYDNQPLFEKGTSFYQQKKYDKAIALFEQSLMLNPYHAGSYRGLSMAYAMEGRLSEAYLAVCFELFITSDLARAKMAFVQIDNINNQIDDYANAYHKKDAAHSNPNFDDIDAIVNSKMALSREYTYKSDFSGDAVVNELHAILEKVRYDASDSSFAMQYFIPLYRDFYKNDEFDPMVLYMFSGYNIGSIDRKAKRKKSDVKEIKTAVDEYLGKIVATGVLHNSARKTAKERYAYIPGDNTFMLGTVKSRTPFTINAGEITLYKNGVLSGKGPINELGLEEGEWKNYYANGVLRSIEHYKNGKFAGLLSYYYENSNLKKTVLYNNEHVATEEKDYSLDGMLNYEAVLAGEKLTVSTYHPNGGKNATIAYEKQNVVDGLYKYYDELTGAVIKEINFENGKKNGLYKEYYADGKLMEKGSLKNDKLDGDYQSFYKNGIMHYKLSYTNGKLDGPYEEYDDNGKLVDKGAYHNGKKTGDEIMMTADGRDYGHITYKNDRPYGYSFTDEKGKTIAQNDEGKNLSHLITYNEFGNKATDIPYEDGKANGKAKYYYSTGSLRKTIPYRSDKVNGTVLEYYHNARLKTETEYADDAEDGYYKEYYETGITHVEGWMKDNHKTGVWRYYNEAGKLDEEVFYLADSRNGPNKNFLGNGRLQFADIYNKDVLEGLIEYDSNGVEKYRTEFAGGNGYYKPHFYNGQARFECAVKRGVLDGPYNKYLPNGVRSEKGFFKNGHPDSTFEIYFQNGKLLGKGQYKNRLKTGTWIYYDENGAKTHETDYVDGEREGKEKIWTNGQLRYETPYHNGGANGNEIIYGDDNKIAAVLQYKDGLLTSYTWNDKDGKLLPPTIVKNATAHIQTFYANGSKGVDMNFKENNHDGKLTFYYSNGQVAEEHNYEGNNLQGPVKKFNVNGKPSYEAMYKDDELTGTEINYDVNGNLFASRQYTDGGILHGASTIVDPKTQEKTTVQYYNNLPVAVQ